MGNDGGSIPTRRELVKEAARNPTVTEIKQTQSERQQHLWTTDPISNTPLVEPIVSDGNGSLHNKGSILEYLLAGEGDDAELLKAEAERILRGAVNSLKDVVELHFTADDSGVDKAARNWKCPITNETLGPNTKAVYVVPCGHVFSATAIKEVGNSESQKQQCLVCNEDYAQNDVIPILPTAEAEITRLTLRSKTLKEAGLRHSLKKLASESKKKKSKEKKNIVAKEDSTVNANRGASSSTVAPSESAATSTINNAATRALTEKVMRAHEESKKRKLDNANVQSLFSAKDDKLRKTNGDFMTRGFSIPANAKR